MHSINRFLDSRISEKSQLIEKLNAVILPLLPASCRAHITAANYDNKELTLIADSPVWAARLRTQHKAISNSLKATLSMPVTSIKIRFQQPVKHKAKPAKELPSLSPESSKLIRQTANSITDEALKASLLRLAKNTNQ